jgi:transposase
MSLLLSQLTTVTIANGCFNHCYHCYYHYYVTFIITTSIITMKTRVQSQHSSTKKAEHDIETRAIALAFRLRGDSYRTISDTMGISYSTLRSFILKFEETGSVKNKARCGCSQKLKAEDKETLKHDVLENRESRTMPLAGITSLLNDKLITEVSQRTVRRALKEQGINCHPAAKKPFVSKRNAIKRVAWSKERLKWKIKDWKKVSLFYLL